MNKAVMLSIQPYYVFLIIAHKMGGDIPQEKTVEIRKNYPQDRAWNKRTYIYCSKNKKSFNRIPTQYQPFMEKFLGKVIGEFVCDRILEWKYLNGVSDENEKVYWVVSKDRHDTSLTYDEINSYGKGKPLYGWHISDLKIYDKPKELSEFFVKGKCDGTTCGKCGMFYRMRSDHWEYCFCGGKKIFGYEVKPLTRPFQSWGYVEEM